MEATSLLKSSTGVLRHRSRYHTRMDQTKDLSLTARGKAAEGCDLFISLHSNACNSSSVDAPLACCTVSGEVNDLGQELADTVASVIGTSQGGTI